MRSRVLPAAAELCEGKRERVPERIVQAQKSLTRGTICYDAAYRSDQKVRQSRHRQGRSNIMPAKTNATAALISDGAKLGEPVPRAVVDTNSASVGIPPQPEANAKEQIGALYKQLDALRQQVSDTASKIKGGVRQAGRQTEASVKLYPVSGLMTVAAIAGAVALVIAGLRSAPPRSRYGRMLDEIGTLYGKLRDRS
jgi:hypothetical protein